ncbi:hypothetical protein BD779DRAFT_1678254 [Infundibulicybe gibba]|nr:hypothetical protein BD779DRAFT_1678254 [Infundibulicybe gibba]
MDPISTVRSLCTLATSLLVWIGQLGEKEEALTSLSTTVSRVCTVLVRFQEITQPTLDPTLVDALYCLGDALHRTEEHLQAWRRRHGRRASLSRVVSFLVPAEVTRMIRQDEQQLSQQLIIILFAMATISYFEKNAPGQVPENNQFEFCPVQNQDVFKFWRDYVGAKAWATSDRFAEALKQKFGNTLNEDACQLLTFCVDELRVGGVSLSSLERFVGNGTVSSAVERFMELELATRKLEPSQNGSLPLLVWVDDNPANNVREIAFAEGQGINVVPCVSTADAKAWIIKNEDFLRAHDAAHSIRFISDNTRLESDPVSEPGLSPYYNITAGENITRFLRGRSLHAPVLIYCGGSIKHTHYVGMYRDAGSTCRSDTVCRYIRALAERKGDDREWVGYQT